MTLTHKRKQGTSTKMMSDERMEFKSAERTNLLTVKEDEKGFDFGRSPKELESDCC